MWRFRNSWALACCTMLIVVCMVTSVVSAGSMNLDEQGLAMRGYDPVAYFLDQEARKGERQYAYEWNGAVWYFSNAKNRKKFIKAPLKFVPQYGGYCALAISHGRKLDADPEVWSIVYGKLYLNYDEDAKSKWLNMPIYYINKAEQVWKIIQNNE